MEQIVLRLVKITLFVALWGLSSWIITKLIMKKKPDLRLYDPEILFPSVLTAALLTRVFMLVLNTIMNSIY